jgi:hypothetical protein
VEQSDLRCASIPDGDLLLHERRAARCTVLANRAIGFLFEGFIGLGRRDVFVLSPFRGWVLLCCVFSFGFGGHGATGLKTLARPSRRSLSSRRKKASKDWAKHLPSSARNDLMTT